MGGVVAGTAMLVGWWDATLSVVQPIRARGWWRPTENKARPFNYDTQMWTPTITPVHVVPTEPIDTTDYLVSSTGDEILTDTTETTKLEAS